MSSFQQIIQKIARIKKVCGLAIHFEGGDQYSLQACLIENNKGIIQIRQSDHSFHTLQQVKDWLGEDIPLRISIDGKGVVHKKIEEAENRELADLLERALPNANPRDFWLQSCVSSTYTHLSIVRKEIIEQLMEESAQLKLNILDIVLGPLGLTTLIPLLEIPADGIKLNNSYYEIDMHQDGIVTFEKSQENVGWQVNIGGESINQNQIHPYALALGEFIPNVSLINSNDHYQQSNREEWEQKVIFKNLLKIGLTAIFFLLLTNFLLFSNFNGKNQSLTYQLAINQNNIAELGKLKKELKEKNKFLNTIGWNGNARLAYFGDRLAMDLPKAIKWQELQLFPLNEQVLKKDKKKIFQSNLIRIAGRSDGPIVLNDWINQLEAYDWVKEIQGQEYKYDSKTRKGEFRFEIIIAEI